MALLRNIKSGFEEVKAKPQLWWTAILAVLIVLGFAVTANMFVSIAQDAQERLINVRIGSIQDVLSEFAPLHIDDEALLQEKIKNIAEINETITDFKILKLEGDNATVIASLDEGDIGSVESELSEILLLALRNNENSYTFKRFGEERLFDTVRSIVDENGKVVGAIVTTQTLSEADKLIDLSIKRSILILVGIVILIMILFLRHSKTIDYISLYRKLKDIDTLKDDFISMASHELRTPLSVISGYASLIADSPDLSEDNVDNIKKIDISINHLNDLVSDMLDVSKIEQGRMELELKTLDPKPVILQVVEGFRIQAEEKGLVFNVDVNKTAKIDMDEGRFKQVLNNIIGNAVKYTAKGNVTVSSDVVDDRFVLKVVDTGVGMTSKEQENLFQKFYRAESAEISEITGTGLGLWITKQLVIKMGGSIEVQSIKGVGTHFILRFPVKEGL